MNQHDLKRILNYDPDTGLFTWAAKTSRKVVVGSVAGCINKAGYVVIGISEKLYYAHQLAWLFQTGQWLDRIDHKDGDRGNNRWGNIRPATPQQNAFNARRAASNTSGFKGVSWHKAAGKWSAYIIVDGKKRHLGLHERPEDAHAAYLSEATAVQPQFVRAS